jgi:hypothetical protein
MVPVLSTHCTPLPANFSMATNRPQSPLSWQAGARIQGLIDSYPNYFFDVHEKDLPDFIDLPAHYEKSPRDELRLAKYGVNRSDERFWQTYDWFQKRFHEDEPVHSGLLDLNRYFHKAL